MENKSQIINEFATKYKSEAINFLLHNFSVLSLEDCKDIFQDSLIVFSDKLNSGNIIKGSLKSYFIGICKYTALNFCRKHKTVPIIKDEYLEKDICSDRIDILIGLDTDYDELKENIVTEMVTMIPEPCNTIFRCCFWDNLRLKTIADMQNKEEGAIRTAKSRCLQKFKDQFIVMFKNLINN